MKHNTIRWTISVVCVLIGVAHTIWPNFSLDTTYIVLLACGLILWLAPIIKSVELPGGFKIEVQDIKEATDKITEAPIPSSGMVEFSNEKRRELPIKEPRDPFETIRQLATTDPNLAMVAFRIELERRLVALAQRQGIEMSHRSAGQLLRELQARKAIPQSVAAGLSDLVSLGNQAAHGADVSPSAALWMVEVGPKVLGFLDNAVQSETD